MLGVCCYGPTPSLSNMAMDTYLQAGHWVGEEPMIKSQTKLLALTFFGGTASCVLTIIPFPLYSANTSSFPGARGRLEPSGAITASIQQARRHTPKYVSHFCSLQALGRYTLAFLFLFFISFTEHSIYPVSSMWALGFFFFLQQT